MHAQASTSEVFDLPKSRFECVWITKRKIRTLNFGFNLRMEQSRIFERTKLLLTSQTITYLSYSSYVLLTPRVAPLQSGALWLYLKLRKLHRNSAGQILHYKSSENAIPKNRQEALPHLAFSLIWSIENQNSIRKKSFTYINYVYLHSRVLHHGST